MYWSLSFWLTSLCIMGTLYRAITFLNLSPLTRETKAKIKAKISKSFYIAKETNTMKR